nr:hypothetical protein CFP56_29876 [Quercus suber]
MLTVSEGRLDVVAICGVEGLRPLTVRWAVEEYCNDASEFHNGQRHNVHHCTTTMVTRGGLFEGIFDHGRSFGCALALFEKIKEHNINTFLMLDYGRSRLVVVMDRKHR